MIGILGALSQEVRALQQAMILPQSQTLMGRTFWQGSLGSQSVVLVEGGVGKVRAAITATLLVSRFPITGLIFTGVAASLHDGLRLGDVVLAHRAIEHDFGIADDAGFQPGIPFVPGLEAQVIEADPTLFEKAQATMTQAHLTPLGATAPRILSGLIASGDIFVAGAGVRNRIRAQTGADAVEMEGSAVVRVAVDAGIPCLLVRSISDEGSSHDFLALVDTVALNSAQLVQQLLG